MADRVLVDTDVFSYHLRDDERWRPFRPFLIRRERCLSFMTVAELLLGARYRGWGPARLRELHTRIHAYHTIHSRDAHVAAFARLVAEALRTGHPVGQPVNRGDAWIAAIAIAEGMPLVTGNRAHFENTPNLLLFAP